MVLEGVISGLVSRYLGDFIALPPENLRIALVSGDLDLKNLLFKPEALRGKYSMHVARISSDSSFI